MKKLKISCSCVLKSTSYLGLAVSAVGLDLAFYRNWLDGDFMLISTFRSRFGTIVTSIDPVYVVTQCVIRASIFT